MGIPSMFRHIVKKYPGTYFWKDNMEVDNLYIDFNSLIYGVIPKIDVKLGNYEYENKLIEEIMNRLLHICNVVNPKKIMYVAVDGTPPRAKMVQQRARRYKTLKEQNFIKDIERKYKVSLPHEWNKSAISPGTTFMSKLSKQIIKNIQMKFFNQKNNKLKIIFSDDSIPGEGEHKILPNLKRIRNSAEVSVVYSPDADLIILAIASGINNIFILREIKDEDIKDFTNEFVYLGVDYCKDAFFKEIDSEESIDNKTRTLIDYSVMTFLCGNDFVTGIPFLKIKEGGIDTLISVYKTIYTDLGQFLVENDYTINYVFLYCLLKELSTVEDDSMKKWQRKRDRIRKGCKTDKESDSLKTPWELEISRFSHEEYYSPKHPLFEVFNRVFDKIDYYNPEWVSKYNKHFFGDTSIDVVCHDYIKSINFCLEYYFKENPSWTWHYPHKNSPSIKDLCKYLGHIIDSENFNVLCPNWEKGVPYTQFEQLMLILPRQSFKLLPKSLDISVESGGELEIYYPKNFILNILHGTKFIYSSPILEEVPEELVKKYIKSVEHTFTILEKERNTIRSRPYVS
jgi:5'-3' exonuclease